MPGLPFRPHAPGDSPQLSTTTPKPTSSNTMRPSPLHLGRTGPSTALNQPQDSGPPSLLPFTSELSPMSQLVVTPDASALTSVVQPDAATSRPMPFPHNADLLGSASESRPTLPARSASVRGDGMDVEIPIASDLETSTSRLRHLRRQEDEERDAQLAPVGHHRPIRHRNSGAHYLTNPGWNELGTSGPGPQPTAFRPHLDVPNSLGNLLNTIETQAPPVFNSRHPSRPVRISTDSTPVSPSPWAQGVPQIGLQNATHASRSPSMVPQRRPSFISPDNQTDFSIVPNPRSPHPGVTRGSYLSRRLDRLDESRTASGRQGLVTRTPPSWSTQNADAFGTTRDDPSSASHQHSSIRLSSDRVNDWHRTVQDAVGRRVSADQSRSNASLYGRLGELEHPTEAGNYFALWGAIPIDSSHTGLHDPTHPWDQRSSSRLRLLRSFAEPETRAEGILPDLETSVRPGNSFVRTWLEPLSDAGVLEPAARILDPSTILYKIKLRPEMAETERLKVVKLVVQYMSKCPGDRKQPLVESTLEYKAHEDVALKDKDVFCSVCHDEYERDTKVTLTPCGHMYHRDCLEIWLHTSNGTSCPMCRRDLAVLACLTKMVPSGTRAEAMPVWLAI